LHAPQYPPASCHFPTSLRWAKKAAKKKGAARRLELLADQPVDRIPAAAAEEDRKAGQPPQQGVFVTLGGPEVAELPLEKDDDDSHLDPDEARR
jgi:hypothetical protein